METNKSEYHLQNIHFSRQSYGVDIGKYKGTITFSNNESESFCFAIQPGSAQKFLDLIRSEVIATANELGQKLAKSMAIELPAPPNQTNSIKTLENNEK